MKKVINNLAVPSYLMIFIGAAFLFFDFQYYLMAKLPGTRNEMCVQGANFTPVNMIFSILLSLLVGLICANMIALFSKRASERKAALSSLSGIGVGVGVVTLFCPICSLPVISLFGLTLGFDFINDFNVWIKLISVFVLLFSLYEIDKQLRDECKRCVFVPKVVKNID